MVIQRLKTYYERKKGKESSLMNQTAPYARENLIQLRGKRRIQGNKRERLHSYKIRKKLIQKTGQNEASMGSVIGLPNMGE
jgi:hypothetical protein